MVLDNQYIESAIFSLWKIDLLNLIKTKAVLAKEFHIQPSEIEKMPYWEYETFVLDIRDMIKEENEKQEQEMSKYNVKGAMKMANPGSMKKMMNSATPGINSTLMPNINHIKF